MLPSITIHEILYLIPTIPLFLIRMNPDDQFPPKKLRYCKLVSGLILTCGMSIDSVIMSTFFG